MRRLRARATARSSAALESPLSWMFLVSLLTLALIWRLYFTFIASVGSCVEVIGFLLGGLRDGPALLDLFTLAFVAAGCLWFVDMVRQHKRRQSYWRRGFEALLIGFGLLSVLIWNEYVRPASPVGGATEAVRGALARTHLFFDEHVPLLDAQESVVLHERGRDEAGRTWEEAFDPGVPGVDNADFPLGIFKRPASECLCWDLREEEVRRERSYLDWQRRYAEMPDGVRNWYEERLAALPPSPVEEDWCPAVRNLARYGV
jgi:hypothetical protein